MRKKFIMFFAIGLFMCGMSFTANAIVLTFDDVSEFSQFYISDGYGGFDWDQFMVYNHNYAPSDSGYNTGVVSGEWVAFNAWGQVASISEDPFNFTGVYLTAAWSVTDLTIIGYNQGSELYRQEVTLTNTSPTWFQADWFNVDLLRFESDQSNPDSRSWLFVMDNFTFNESVSIPVPVPEPLTLILVGTGLLALAGLKRKFKD